MLGLAVLGIGVVAAAPFTGGGSLLGAASLGASLTGAGTVAAGGVGAVVGHNIDEKEKAKEKKRQEKIAEANLKADKFENIASEHEEHTNYIYAVSALGISIANADGKISEAEELELNEFIGGLSSSKYPQHIIDEIGSMISNPPTFQEALKHLEKIEIEKYDDIRNLLVVIAESDGDVCVYEKAYIEAFDRYVSN